MDALPKGNGGDRDSPPRGGKKHRGSRVAGLTAAALPYIGASVMLPSMPTGEDSHWNDMDIHRWIRKLYPEDWLRTTKLPPLSDIVTRRSSARAQDHDLEPMCFDTFTATKWVAFLR